MTVTHDQDNGTDDDEDDKILINSDPSLNKSERIPNLKLSLNNVRSHHPLFPDLFVM